MRIVYRLQVHLLHSMLKNVELQGLYEELDCFSASIRVVFWLLIWLHFKRCFRRTRLMRLCVTRKLQRSNYTIISFLSFYGATTMCSIAIIIGSSWKHSWHDKKTSGFSRLSRSASLPQLEPWYYLCKISLFLISKQYKIILYSRDA